MGPYICMRRAFYIKNKSVEMVKRSVVAGVGRRICRVQRISRTVKLYVTIQPNINCTVLVIMMCLM